MKIKDLPEVRRPREKLIAHGPDHLSTTELLAIIIGSGRQKINAVELAKKIIAEIGANHLGRSKITELKKIFGLGQTKACQIVACFELGRRLLINKDVPTYLTNSEEVITLVEKLLADTRIYTSLRFKTNHEYILSKLNQKTKDRKTSQELLAGLQKFKCLNNESVYQLLLTYLNKFLNYDRYSAKQLRTDLNKLWIFTFRAKIIIVNPAEYEKIFTNHCLWIKNYSSVNPTNMSTEFFLQLKELIKDKRGFIANFPSELKYGRDNELIIHVLEQIYQLNNQEIKFSHPSLEHIVPRKPVSWGLSPAQVKDVVHNIGNLTLLSESDNNAANNATMAEKAINVYAKSSFQLNRDLADRQADFTKNFKKAIQTRGHELAVLAEKTFNY